MRGTRVVWIVALLTIVSFGGTLVARLTAPTPALIAGAEDLVQYPSPLEPERIPLGERLYVVVLPETERAVVLRPLTPEEFGSYQVQAVAAEMIDQKMLAAAIVLPAVGTGDVAVMSPDLVDLLEAAVDRISGFAVFGAAGP